MPRVIQSAQQLLIKALPRKRIEDVMMRWDGGEEVNWEEKKRRRSSRQTQDRGRLFSHSSPIPTRPHQGIFTGHLTTAPYNLRRETQTGYPSDLGQTVPIEISGS